MNVSNFINILSSISILFIVSYKTYLTISLIIQEFYWLIIGLVTLPVLFLFIIFPVHFTISNLIIFCLPSPYWYKNSKYFIHQIPEIVNINLPDITIQIPVYDEDFKKVLRHTLRDCIKARQYYISCGGKCNIIVNDDGIFKFLNDRLIDLDQNEIISERISYYKKYNISFTARKFSDRAGKFKKASNMNYCQQINAQQTPLASAKRLISPVTFSNEQKFTFYDIMKKRKSYEDIEKQKYFRKKRNSDEQKFILKNIEELIVPPEDEVPIISRKITPKYKPYLFKDIVINKSKRHMYYGNINMGKYILLVDSDTKVPEKILPSIVKLFEVDPELGYTQHYTVPLESSYQNYFSTMISYFTENLYNVIFRVCTRNGDISPLIGHNIVLRKEAMEKISDDGKFWNENRVSEDFDLCLRMYENGYKGMYVCHETQPFGEGVSLTYRDEIIKYSKFAYGASEIIFNPVREWCKKGILTKSFKNFMKSSNVPISSKIGILGYLTTYFSISSSVIFTPIAGILSCFVPYWELILFDPFYAYMFLFVVYGIFNPLVNYKLKRQFPKKNEAEKQSLIREYICSFFFCVFYCSISFPLFFGLISHLFSINISWGSTVKSVEKDTRFNILKSIVKEEKIQFFCSFVFLIFTIFLKIYFNLNFVMLFPLLSLSLGHLIVPIVLNPYLWCSKEYKFDIRDTP